MAIAIAEFGPVVLAVASWRGALLVHFGPFLFVSVSFGRKMEGAEPPSPKSAQNGNVQPYILFTELYREIDVQLSV